MRVERELCCDDEAVAACGNPIEYARALAGLEALRPAPRFAPAATGGPLFERIARLVAAPSSHGVRATRAATALLGVRGAGPGPHGRDEPARPGDGEPERDGDGGEARARREAHSGSGPHGDRHRARPVRPRPASGARGDTERRRRLDPPRPGRAPHRAGRRRRHARIRRRAWPGWATRTCPGTSSSRCAAQGVGPEYVQGPRGGGLPASHAGAARLAAHAGRLAGLRARDGGAGDEGPVPVRAPRAAHAGRVARITCATFGRAGYADLSVTDLLGARSNGVSPEDAVALRGMGYTDLSLSRLVGLRSMGVTADYVRGLQAQGYKGLSTPMLFGLRSQGVSRRVHPRAQGPRLRGPGSGRAHRAAVAGSHSGVRARAQGRGIRPAHHARADRPPVAWRRSGAAEAPEGTRGAQPMTTMARRIAGIGLGALAAVAGALRRHRAAGERGAGWADCAGSGRRSPRAGRRRTAARRPSSSSRCGARAAATTGTRPSRSRLADLKGLTAEQTRGARTDVRFDLVRDAGTMAFEGRFDDGDGAGHFTFTADPAVPAGDAQAGLRRHRRGEGLRARHPRREPRRSSAS